MVVTAGEGWHPGVVGLVAARLKERYGRPAFATNVLFYIIFFYNIIFI